MNLISSNNFFKNTITPLIRSSKSKLQEEEYSINDKESPINFSNKTLLFQKKNLLQKHPRIFSTRNPKMLSKLNINIKSATIKSPNLNKNIFHPIKLKKDKMSNTGISFYRNNSKKIKRNYSAYYIKSDLPLEKSYISDFLIKNNENKKNSKSKITEIEEKIKKLGKTMNLYLFKKNKSSSIYLNRSFSSIPQKRIMSQYNYRSHNNEEVKNKNDAIPDYLKNEFNIKGTKILSPFCTKARDSFILQKFIRYFNDKNNLKSDKKYINNKLNIIYAENEEAYNMKLALLNKKLNKKGKIDRYKIDFSPTEKLLRDMEKKVTFMKNIIEYAYPNTALMRMRIPESKKYYTNYKYKYDFKNEELNNEKLNEVQSQIYNFPNKTFKTNYSRKKFYNIFLYK